VASRRASANRVARALLATSALAIIATTAVIAVRAVQDDTQEAPFIVSADENSVVIRSIEDASVVRTLATGRNARDVQRVVVSPDGKLVYFSRGWPRRCPNWDEGNEDEMVTKDHSEIVRVSSGGGDIEHVAWGQDPVIAANGDLFYLSSEGTGRDVIGYPCNADPIEFIRRLRGPNSKGPGKAIYSHNGPAPTIFPLTARPDGRALIANHDPNDYEGRGARQMVFTMATPPFPPERNEADDPEGGGVARTTRAVVFPKDAGDDSAVVGFIGASTAAGTLASGGDHYLATFDPYNGQRVQRLFDVDAATEVVSDTRGRDYLVLDTRRDTHVVRRWSREEGFVDIGTFPVGPVTWTGGVKRAARTPLGSALPSPLDDEVRDLLGTAEPSQ
jgi:hypothetical protein